MRRCCPSFTPSAAAAEAKAIAGEEKVPHLFVADAGAGDGLDAGSGGYGYGGG